MPVVFIEYIVKIAKKINICNNYFSHRGYDECKFVEIINSLKCYLLANLKYLSLQLKK